MAEMTGRWAIVVHGGAKRIDTALLERNRAGCARAAEAGAALLREGRPALLAAEAATRVLEDDPVFNAGFGSVLNAEGAVEMDAAIMDGATLRIGAVAAVRRLRNPIAAASALLEARPVLLVADGAERFASAQGIELCDPEDMISPERLASEYDRGHDTVGCVAIDTAGHLAAATSTGGLSGKAPGRVGDTPVPGCGYYADDALGAAAFSGDGESILRTLLAARTMQALEHNAAKAAAEAAIVALARVGGEAGVIVLDAQGRVGIAHNSDNFALGLHSSGLAEARGAASREELEEFLDGQ
jgi:beta-aspartyl-peptidase (threonine type)